MCLTFLFHFIICCQKMSVNCQLQYFFICRPSSSSSSIEPLHAVNRLRVSPHASLARMCSRCSSLLTLASTSRYSLNSSTGGFVQIPPDDPPILCKLCLVDVPSKDVVHIEMCNCAFCKEVSWFKIWCNSWVCSIQKGTRTLNTVGKKITFALINIIKMWALTNFTCRNTRVNQ